MSTNAIYFSVYCWVILSALVYSYWRDIQPAAWAYILTANELLEEWAALDAPSSSGG